MITLHRFADLRCAAPYRFCQVPGLTHGFPYAFTLPLGFRFTRTFAFVYLARGWRTFPTRPPHTFTAALPVCSTPYRDRHFHSRFGLRLHRLHTTAPAATVPPRSSAHYQHAVTRTTAVLCGLFIWFHAVLLPPPYQPAPHTFLVAGLTFHSSYLFHYLCLLYGSGGYTILTVILSHIVTVTLHLPVPVGILFERYWFGPGAPPTVVGSTYRGYTPAVFALFSYAHFAFSPTSPTYSLVCVCVCAPFCVFCIRLFTHAAHRTTTYHTCPTHHHTTPVLRAGLLTAHWRTTFYTHFTPPPPPPRFPAPPGFNTLVWLRLAPRGCDTPARRVPFLHGWLHVLPTLAAIILNRMVLRVDVFFCCDST